MSAHLTAALRCSGCGNDWAIEKTPWSDHVVAVANVLLSTKCPKCRDCRFTVRTMRFCSVAKPEKDAG